MTEYCRFCGGYSRDACSLYQGTALARELRACPNLEGRSRWARLYSANVDTPIDWEMEKLRQENERLRAALDPEMEA
jgi:hypothetical protein